MKGKTSKIINYNIIKYPTIYIYIVEIIVLSMILLLNIFFINSSVLLSIIIVIIVVQLLPYLLNKNKYRLLVYEWHLLKFIENDIYSQKFRNSNDKSIFKYPTFKLVIDQHKVLIGLKQNALFENTKFEGFKNQISQIFNMDYDNYELDNNYYYLEYVPKTKPLTMGTFEPYDKESNSIIIDTNNKFNIEQMTLLAAKTGSGKSVFLEFILNIIQTYDLADFDLVDVKNSYDSFQNSDNYYTTKNQALKLLRMAINKMEERYKHRDYDSRPYILIVEEVSALVSEFNKKEMEEWEQISTILNKGRQAKVFLWLVGHEFSMQSNIFSNSNQRNNFQQRILLGNFSTEMSSQILQVAKSELPIKPNLVGSGYLYSDTMVVPKTIITPRITK